MSGHYSTWLGQYGLILRLFLAVPSRGVGEVAVDVCVARIQHVDVKTAGGDVADVDPLSIAEVMDRYTYGW